MQPPAAPDDEKVLISITVTRKKRKIAYKVHCAKEVKNEELAHYLDEIIEGICTWKPAICEDTFQSVAEPLTQQNKEVSPNKPKPKTEK